MKPVQQAIIDPKRGDCLRACLASLLELELEQVPNFLDDLVKGHCPIVSANQWLAPRNLALLDLAWQWDHAYWFALHDVYCIFSVPSQKFNGSSHAVVGRFWLEHDILKTEIVHDPNPFNQPYPADVEFERVCFLLQRCQ